MNKQHDLKNQLLPKEINPEEFLGALLVLDQSSNDHVEAIENIEILEDLDVSKLFLNADLEIKYDYYLHLRNYYFHFFQYLALKSESPDKFLYYLDKAALLSVPLKNLVPEDSDLFATYIYGTVCYINNDQAGLLKNIQQLEKAPIDDFLYGNVDVLKRLYSGLVKFGTVNYLRDY